MAARAIVQDQGQLTIPEEIRKHAHLKPGDVMEVELTGDGILLRPLPPPVEARDPDQWWFWTEEWQAGEREASAEAAAGHGEIFLSGEDFLKALKERSKLADL